MKVFLVFAILFSVATSESAAQNAMVSIPIKYKDISVSFEMPKQWANSEFGYRAVPADIDEKLKTSDRFVICMKDLSWSRSLFRGPLGHMIVDVTIDRWPEKQTLINERQPKPEEYQKLRERADFLHPKDLYDKFQLTLVEGWQNGSRRSISFVNINNRVWVRLNRISAIWSGIPTSEILVLGLDRRTFLRIDLAVVRNNEAPPGEVWLKDALYWQSKIIESIRITGLNQILAGDEKVEEWRFPETLKYSPELLK